MGQYWKSGEGKDSDRFKDRDGCAESAYELHNFWKGKFSFPVFWSLIGYDRERLAKIFLFFCAMRNLLRCEQARRVGRSLENRLNARWKGDAAPIPFELKDDIGFLSENQIRELSELEEDGLVVPAFELFASGALTSARLQYMTGDEPVASSEKSGRDREYGDFEPDGPAFFLWAEFAFLASYAGFAPDEWRRILPVLLRSERVFALCYGQPEYGVIPGDRVYSEYDPEQFCRIHPLQASQFGVLAIRRFEELEAEATDCARFAFPGEF